MARTRSQLSAVREGASALFAELQTWELQRAANEVNQTVIGGAVGGTGAGSSSYRLSGEGFFDVADAGQSALQIGAEGVTLTVFPAGIGSGLPQRIGVYTILTYNDMNPDADGKVRFSFEAASDGSAALDETAQT